MAQTIILAAGTTAATSTDVTLAAGAFANIAAYTSSSQWLAGLNLGVYLDTGGDDALIATLNRDTPRFLAQGPGVYRVRRPATSQAIGVSSDA